MSILFSNTSQGFYSSELDYKNGLPDDLQQVTEEQHIEILSKLNLRQQVIFQDGKITSTDNTVASPESERAWRNSELSRADIELNKIQDGESGTQGTVASWREYRKALRAWPQATAFPLTAKRPKSPDYKD